MKLNKNFFRKAIDEGFKIFLYTNNKAVGTISEWNKEDIRIFLMIGKFRAVSKIEDITKCNKIIFDRKEKRLEVVG